MKHLATYAWTTIFAAAFAVANAMHAETLAAFHAGPAEVAALVVAAKPLGLGAIRAHVEAFVAEAAPAASPPPTWGSTAQCDGAVRTVAGTLLHRHEGLRVSAS